MALGKGDDMEMREAVRREVEAWDPARGPDLRDLVHRVERPWRGPVALGSVLALVGLAVVFVIALALVLLAPQIPGGESVRERLLGP
ncbi:MAG: hypothetical protein M3024_06255 [Candidatus Dormibacteraeota bacterium]|nr:hypothetical protein [Candidatus Dormibacteraeota bacterium]